jgi:hypothetical protein
MPDDMKRNEPDSDTTRAAGSGAPGGNAPSEAEFLAREADAAKDAASHALDDVRQSLSRSSDVGAWVKRYPWSALGVAAAAGFVAVAALVPRRRRREDEPPALLERILTDEQIAARLRKLAAEDEGRAPRDDVVRSVVTTLLKTFGPAVQSAVTAATAARAAQHADDPANGQTHDAPDSPAPGQP